MKHHFRERVQQVPLKGGLIGAVIGAVASVFLHKPDEKPVWQAGKTILFSGAGFLIGNWVEKKNNRGTEKK